MTRRLPHSWKLVQSSLSRRLGPALTALQQWGRVDHGYAGRYLVSERIGVGGMGKVYRAET